VTVRKKRADVLREVTAAWPLRNGQALPEHSSKYQLDFELSS
jgi:hypothetical protein